MLILVPKKEAYTRVEQELCKTDFASKLFPVVTIGMKSSSPPLAGWVVLIEENSAERYASQEGRNNLFQLAVNLNIEREDIPVEAGVRNFFLVQINFGQISQSISEAVAKTIGAVGGYHVNIRVEKSRQALDALGLSMYIYRETYVLFTRDHLDIERGEKFLEQLRGNIVVLDAIGFIGRDQ